MILSVFIIHYNKIHRNEEFQITDKCIFFLNVITAWFRIDTYTSTYTILLRKVRGFGTLKSNDIGYLLAT